MTKTLVERNEQIRLAYVGGATLEACAREHHISRERVRQILRKLEVLKRERKPNSSGRRAFIGVNITESTKTALQQKAADAGISVSKMTSDTLDELVAPAAGEVKP